MKFYVTEHGTPPFQFVKIITLKFIDLKKTMGVLGRSTRNYMREIIETQKHRKSGSSGRLEKAINYYIEPTPNYYTVGIGLIEELNYSAPYWYLVNYGGMSTIAARGGTLYGNFDGINPPLKEFAGTGVGHGYFYEGRNPSFPMKPKNPVWAMSYIQRTTSWVNVIYKIHFYGWARKTVVHIATSNPADLLKNVTNF